MPSYDKVSIMERSGAIIYYSSYSSARSAASSGDLIQIWANLDEEIILLDGVDIWVMPGVTISFDSENTIVDNKISVYTDPVECNVYGYGVIKNVGTKSCVKIINSQSKINIECNYIDGLSSVAVYVLPTEKFHLKCNYVYNHYSQAIQIGDLTQTGLVNDLYLNSTKVVTGDLGYAATGTTAIITRGNGFINFDEIICNNLGHCLSHREGSIVANVRKLTTTTNRSGAIAALHVPGPTQGSGDQNLVLYFDEINSLAGTTFSSGVSVELTGGNLNLLGRKLLSKNLYGVICGGILQKGQIICNEIISENFYALNIANYNTEVSIAANSIKSNYQPSTGFSPVVYLYGTTIYHPKCLIKNAYLINQNSATNAKGIFFDNIYPVLTLYNVKIVAGSEDNNIIYLSNGTSVDVYNYGMYGNKNIDDEVILLKIGDPDNFLFIESNDLA